MERTMPDIPAFPLQIFYDGSCSVCAGEMEFYRRKKHDNRLLFIDITAPEFDPAPYGISQEAFMYELHAIDRQGRIYKGIEAFGAIWLAFPDLSVYRLLGTLVALPGVNPLALMAYWSFARIRNYLPNSSNACKDASCRLGKDRPQP
jgi:predicted DCC family thiol-disulfide oxidoreductase YuxK